MTRVTPHMQGKIRAFEELGLSISDIAHRTNLPRRTVEYWRTVARRRSAKRSSAKKEGVVLRRHLVEKLVKERQRVIAVRRTPKLRKERFRQDVQQPYNSASRIAAALKSLHGIAVSPSTVRRDLIANGRRPLVRRGGPALTNKHAKARVKFAREWVRRNRSKRLVFSDEKLFSSNQSRRQFQWCAAGETPEPMRREQGAPGVMAWAAIGPGGSRAITVLRKASVTREIYEQQILQPNVANLKKMTGPRVLFMQDNARPHVGGLQFLKRRGVPVLEAWPSLSCDMNPIEQLWSILALKVQRRCPWGEEELTKCIVEEFKAIPNKTIDALVNSFTSRCEAVIRAGGATIKPD